MKFLSIFSFFFISVTLVQSQNLYRLSTGRISFFAGTTLEDIDAYNIKSSSLINLTTGEIIISIPNKDFIFRRSLMQEHFNENYMETDKYPKSEFKGKITDIQNVDFSKDEFIKVVTVDGILNIHGISKPRQFEVKITKTKSTISGETEFLILLEDHNIKRPKILWEKLADKVKVTANLVYEPYQK